MAFPTDPRERRSVAGMILLGFLILIGGVMGCILSSALTNAAIDTLETEMTSLNGYHNHAYTAQTFWYGFGFIVSGIICMVAGGTGNRGMHITNIVISSIGLVVYDIWAIALIAAVSVIGEVGAPSDCLDRSSCKRMISYTQGLTANVVISWVLMLVSHILSCSKTCCVGGQPGAVIHHQGPTTTIMTSHTTGQHYIAPQHMQPGYAPHAAGYAPHAAGHAPNVAGHAPNVVDYQHPPAYTTKDSAVLVNEQY